MWLCGRTCRHTWWMATVDWQGEVSLKREKWCDRSAWGAMMNQAGESHMGTAEAKQGWRDTLTHLPAGRAPRDSPAEAVWAGHCLAGGPHTHHCLLTPALPPCLPITGCWPRDPPAGAVWAGHRPAGGPLPRPPLPAAAPPALGPRAALLSQPGPAGPPAASAARRGARWVAVAQGRRMGWRGVAASLCAGEVGGTAQHSTAPCKNLRHGTVSCC